VVPVLRRIIVIYIVFDVVVASCYMGYSRCTSAATITDRCIDDDSAGEVRAEVCRRNFRAENPRIFPCHRSSISTSCRVVRTACQSASHGLNFSDR